MGDRLGIPGAVGFIFVFSFFEWVKFQFHFCSCDVEKVIRGLHRGDRFVLLFLENL